MDGRDANSDVKFMMLTAEDIMREMWLAGVRNAYPEIQAEVSGGQELPKRPRLNTFPRRTSTKRSKPRAVLAKDKHILELKRVVNALYEVGTEQGLGHEPSLISGMPPQMESLQGFLYTPQKTSVLRHPNKLAPGAHFE